MLAVTPASPAGSVWSGTQCRYRCTECPQCLLCGVRLRHSSAGQHSAPTERPRVQATTSKVYETLQGTADSLYKPIEVFQTEGLGPANVLFAVAMIVTSFSLISGTGESKSN